MINYTVLFVLLFVYCIFIQIPIKRMTPMTIIMLPLVPLSGIALFTGIWHSPETAVISLQLY
jgi:hypothetical protein